MTSSNATPSAFGWDFQANLGLYLIMDEDLKQIKKFKIEGETEDIEIYYRDTTERKPKFIQAKSQEDPISDGTTSKHLSNAMSSLLQVVTKVSGEYSELIYGTNIEIPIRARVKQKLFEGNRIKLYYKELPEQFQAKIDGIVDVSEITNEQLMSFKERLSILKISFYGQDNETRYKVVQEKVTSKLRSLGIEQYKCNRIFYYFQKEFIQNASKRVEYSIEDLGLTIILFSFEDEENWSFNNLDIPEPLQALNVELEEVVEGISRLKQLKKIVDYQHENTTIIKESNFESTKLLDLEKNLSMIMGKISSLESEKDTLRVTLEKNEEYLAYLENLHLFIKAPESGEEFLLKKEFVKGFGAYQKIIELKIYNLERKIKELRKKEEKIRIEIRDSEKFFNTENTIELFENRLNLLVVPKETIGSELSRLKNRKKELESIRLNYLSSELMQKIYENIMYFAKKLDVAEYLEHEKDFILTSDLKSYSGTILHKLVFCFKLAYIVELQKYLGFRLPIVLDSPSGREVDQKNIEDMFKILNEDFVDNQIIIASIFEYPLYSPDKIIKINKNLLE